MIKKIAIVLLMAFLPIMASAQNAGGQVTRPVKKQQTTNKTPKKKPISKTQKEQEAPKQKQIEQKPSVQETAYNAIIRQLISNMVYVEGGTFTMGATSEQESYAYGDERPAHQVTLSSFYIGKYEVTQEEWEAVMGENPSYCKGGKHPIESISWIDCQVFIKKLNIMTGKNFRLPTEAEWEYAARGGKKRIGYLYAGSDNLDKVAWYNANCGGSTHDVGKKYPNELGLYDMSGNVEEWCSDWYGRYSSNSQMNPYGPSSGSSHVFRGGGWKSNVAGDCRISLRKLNGSEYRDFNLGFRIAM